MNVTRFTHRYIAERPSIKDCMRRGLINYSALSREICDNEGIERFDAVLMACRRYFNRIKDQQSQERKITQLVKQAKIRLKNKITVAILEKPRDFERLYALQKQIRSERGDFNLVEGEEAVTVIFNQDYEAEIRESFKGRIKKVVGDLAQITMIFNEKIETTSGVVSFIYGLLADNEVNVREEMSCWTDLMMVIDEKDASKAMRVLSLEAVS
ncbi:MAG: hypothetical protein K1X83_03995 [Oligoflexia bacterium]|nr:hypothetical protein [Oligoflexia bacterium]